MHLPPFVHFSLRDRIREFHVPHVVVPYIVVNPQGQHIRGGAKGTYWVYDSFPSERLADYGLPVKRLDIGFMKDPASYIFPITREYTASYVNQFTTSDIERAVWNDPDQVEKFVNFSNDPLYQWRHLYKPTLVMSVQGVVPSSFYSEVVKDLEEMYSQSF